MPLGRRRSGLLRFYYHVESIRPPLSFGVDMTSMPSSGDVCRLRGASMAKKRSSSGKRGQASGLMQEVAVSIVILAISYTVSGEVQVYALVCDPCYAYTASSGVNCQCVDVDEESVCVCVHRAYMCVCCGLHTSGSDAFVCARSYRRHLSHNRLASVCMYTSLCMYMCVCHPVSVHTSITAGCS